MTFCHIIDEIYPLFSSVFKTCISAISSILYCVDLNENTNHCYPAFQLSRKQFRFNLKIIVQATFSIKTYFKDIFDCSRKAMGKIANMIVYLQNYSSHFDLDCRNFYGKSMLQVAKRFLKNNEML